MACTTAAHHDDPDRAAPAVIFDFGSRTDRPTRLDGPRTNLGKGILSSQDSVLDDAARCSTDHEKHVSDYYLEEYNDQTSSRLNNNKGSSRIV